jgi:acyl-CoA synthetase (AMP-forming)/AMP-acid ligase II
MGLELFHRIWRHAAERGGDAAVRVVGGCADGFGPWTWRGLADAIARVARRLDGDERLGPDATVLLLSPNRPAMAAVFLGGLAAGLRLMPVDAASTRHEIAQLAERVGAAAVLADQALAEGLGPWSMPVLGLEDLTSTATEAGADAVEAFEDRGERAWLLLQSSGTTGGPKIVRRDGRSLDAVARNVAEAVGLVRSDRVMAAVPLSHSYGIENGLLAPLWAGACALHHVRGPGQIGRGFDPATMLEQGATVLPGVPSMFEMIDRLELSSRDLRLAYSAGASLPPELAKRLADRDGLTLGQLYGSTEIGSVTFGLDAATVGRPMAGVEVRILDPDRPEPDAPLPDGAVGHVAVRAPSMFVGYLHDRPENRAAVIDGFFLTGDLGRLDERGHLTITGRLKLLINVGGVKVNPIEVESAIAQFPGVAACVVLPDPVSPTVSRVRAVLQLEAEQADFDESALRAFLRQRLAAHKVPRTFERRASLPTSPTGKVLRRELLDEKVPA